MSAMPQAPYRLGPIASQEKRVFVVQGHPLQLDFYLLLPNINKRGKLDRDKTPSASLVRNKF